MYESLMDEDDGVYEQRVAYLERLRSDISLDELDLDEEYGYVEDIEDFED